MIWFKKLKSLFFRNSVERHPVLKIPYFSDDDFIRACKKCAVEEKEGMEIIKKVEEKLGIYSPDELYVDKALKYYKMREIYKNSHTSDSFEVFVYEQFNENV